MLDRAGRTLRRGVARPLLVELVKLLVVDVDVLFDCTFTRRGPSGVGVSGECAMGCCEENRTAGGAEHSRGKHPSSQYEIHNWGAKHGRVAREAWLSGGVRSQV